MPRNRDARPLRPTSRLAALLAALACFGAAPLAAAGAETIYLAPDGDDGWSGSLARPNAGRSDGPLASLRGARDRVRALKAGGPPTEPVRVVVADGTFALHEPVVFEPRDGGTARAPVVYEAAPAPARSSAAAARSAGSGTTATAAGSCNCRTRGPGGSSNCSSTAAAQLAPLARRVLLLDPG